ncbi:MAG: helix-turn-helix transcriptional regulator, partial [Eggerthellaceae bacterium]|nr:helix-turn-helix transcriptional regulator [Eggerthellaceae bacterium]
MDMKQPIHSAEWLTDTRKRANLTMKQLAELTGLHSQSIYNIESSKYGSS